MDHWCCYILFKSPTTPSGGERDKKLHVGEQILERARPVLVVGQLRFDADRRIAANLNRRIICV
jgi:hypothetical protein